MDSAPLNSAHAHARSAAVLSQGPSLSSAREEHEAAAQDFAKAKSSVGDAEALRILELLESHHRQLAFIIKSQSMPAKPEDDATANKDASATKVSTPTDPHIPRLATRTSTSPVRTRRLHRETSTTIADNLARQRRGLPSQAEVSSLNAGGRILSHIDRPGYGSRQRSPESARSLPTVAESRILDPVGESVHAKAGAGDDGAFSKWYTTFNGLFDKLSGPLAFAGLPLNPDQPSTQTAPEKEKKKEKITRASSSDEPDLTKIYSAAALKAIREDVGPSFGPQESFYLVPPTGGTISYAGMVSGGHPPSLSREPTIEEDDEFVDARENIAPPSPRSLRNSQRKGHSPAASRDGRRPKSSGKTGEELELEITVLKQLLDTQAKRLQMWEMSSQSQSMALQQSMRAVRQRPDLPAISREPSAATADAESARIKELEELLRAEKEEREKVEKKSEQRERENQRLVTTVGRYRDKWEQLKAGARKREDDKRRKADGDGETKVDGEEVS